MLTKTYPRVIDRVGDLNPQLFREIKGRLKPRNVIIVSAFSLIGQFFIYLCFHAQLPLIAEQYSRYCTGEEKYYRGGECITDLAGNIMTLRQLWWLDMFITMSIIGVFALLVVGSYMLVTDIAKEESKGTLDFIRLSPQSAWTIWTGKMLGVPSLVYLFGALAIPLHLVAGLSANIPLPLILSFYLVLSASCFFFFSACLLINSSVKSNLGSFQGILVAGAVFFFLFITTSVVLNSYGEYSSTSFDWFLLLSPSTYLVYLVKSTFLADRTIDYLNPEGLMNLNWYGKFLWQNAVTGLGFILLNYGIWSFWLWQGLKRRFHNPTGTVISKYHSYWLSACFIVFNLGFGLQQNAYSHDENLIFVQIFNLVLFLILIMALSPHRQTLQDWARYRHQHTSAKRTIWHDLLLGEKSPAVAAIALNVLIVTLYLVPTILLFPFEEEKSLLITGFILSGGVILLYATVMQLLLMLKTNRRQFIANSVVVMLMIIPVVAVILAEAVNYGELNISLTFLETIGLFLPIPLLGVAHVSSFSVIGSSIGYLVGLLTLNWQLKRVLHKAGKSETKMLLDSSITVK